MDYGNITRSGSWLKAADVKSGSKAKILDETTRIESQFKDDKGNVKFQDVCKLKVEGLGESVNASLNRATIRGLVEAFGKDSKDWIGKVVTIHTEKTTVAGRRVTAMYLLPEGFEVGESEDGYVQIVRSGDKPAAEPDDFVDDMPI